MSFKVLSTNHTMHPINTPIAINAGPNKGRKVAYLRDADGVTVEFIGAPRT